jgi:replicative DNA helicase
MFISRKEYNFLKENAEKNINAECKILNLRDKHNKLVAVISEKYFNVLEQNDKLEKRVKELEKQLETYKTI